MDIKLMERNNRIFRNAKISKDEGIEMVIENVRNRVPSFSVMWRVILSVVYLFRVLVGLSLPSFLYTDLCETSSEFGVWKVGSSPSFRVIRVLFPSEW
ncbi:hypothetical protein Acr_07g0012860 [Actinidia rufa]|uniref:Uncharacterized protein n=1 Tax=Actinidia rufa TaxID=165716 RepID=A0A7J0EXF5_9ERIC|nr:hypothetical protein Acr_07g0012860 [Actinidia rufa]